MCYKQRGSERISMHNVPSLVSFQEVNVNEFFYDFVAFSLLVTRDHCIIYVTLISN